MIPLWQGIYRVLQTGITGQDVIDQGNRQFRKWLTPLRQFLKAKLKDDYKATKTTKRSIQFKYKGLIDVDLLVSPYWETADDFYDFLKGIPRGKRARYPHIFPTE